MQKVVITGGAGFIGTELTKALVSKGYHVHILDRNKPVIEKPNVSYTICDVSLGINPEDIEGVRAS